MSSITISTARAKEMAEATILKIQGQRAKAKDDFVKSIIKKSRSRWLFPRDLTYEQAEAMADRSDLYFKDWTFIGWGDLPIAQRVKRACDIPGVDHIHLSLKDYEAISR